MLPLRLGCGVGLVGDNHDQDQGTDATTGTFGFGDQTRDAGSEEGRLIDAVAGEEIIVAIFSGKPRSAFAPGAPMIRIGAVGLRLTRQSSIWKKLPLKSERRFAQSSRMMVTYSAQYS